ncbi:MAG: DUF2232 domain-containing protein [Clostridiales bacterium]|nr:DUF2232 domain-containing protein [Clostridiales bacterium]
MDIQEHRKAVKSGIIAVAVMSIIGTLAPVIPAATLLVYLAAVLFFVCAKRYGFIFTLPFLIAAYVFVAFGTSFITAIADILAPGLAALVMGELMKLNREQSEVVLKGILTGALCNLASVAALKITEEVSLLSQLRTAVDTIISTGISSGELTAQAAQSLEEAYEVMLQMVPAFLVAGIMLGTVFVYFAGCAIMRKTGEEMYKFLPFKEFSFSKSIIFGGIIILILSYIIGAVGLVNSDVLLLNICMVLAAMFSLQGLAVLSFISSMVRIPRILIFIFVLLLMLSMIGILILFFIGLVDLAMDLRKRIKAKRG